MQFSSSLAAPLRRLGLAVISVCAALTIAACGGAADAGDAPDASVRARSAAALAAEAVDGWTLCASEGQACAFADTRQVRYGAPGSVVTRTLSGGTACTNAVFGDPAPAREKWCWVAEPAASTAGWTRCASEGQACAFDGTHRVRYGTATQQAVAVFTGGTACSNAVFGDPAVAQAKSCWVEDATAAAVADSWTKCASEGGRCSYSGTRSVRYGTATQYVTRSYADGTACTNEVFGDPAPAQAKWCRYADAADAPAAAASASWTRCASEGQRCSFSGTREVRYGTATQTVTRTASDGVACTNQVFGDPAVGQAKSCWYADAAAAASAPAPALPAGEAANAPVVLNAPSSGRAGDVVTLQGERFGSAPQVVLEGYGALPPVNQVAGSAVAVQLPAGARGALTLRVVAGGVSSAPVRLNAAFALHLDAQQLVPGGAFRVFGRNLRVDGSTPTLRVDGLVAEIDVAASDEHVLVAIAPRALAATPRASVTVDNGNGSGPAALERSVEVVAGGGADPLRLGVGWGAVFDEFAARGVAAASDPRLAQRATCDGRQDMSRALQGAIDLAAAGGGGIVRLPAGTCRLAGGVSLRSRVVLEGAGKDATLLRYESNYPFVGVGLDAAGVRNLSLVNAGSAVEGALLKDSTRVFLQNVRFATGTARHMYFTGNRQMVVRGCEFQQGGSVGEQGPYLFDNAAGLVFADNATRWVNGASSFGRVHDSVIENNRYTRDAAYQNAAGVVHAITLDFAYRVAVLGNTFDVVNGPIRNKARNDGETILSEGGGAMRTENLGSVTEAGARSLTDRANTIDVDPFREGAIPENYGIAIVHGKGAGQTRTVVGYADRTLEVDRPWDVVPDASSRYATFVWGLQRSLVKGNRLAQTPRGIWLYHTAVRDVDIVGNQISEGGGIYLRSYQNLAQKLFMPIYNVRIAANRIANSTGEWGSYVNSVFVNADARAFGIANIGIEIRDNEVVANAANLSSALEEYAGTEGLMGMMRVENYDLYEPMALPRQIGTVFERNQCTYCEVAIRIGTGAGGTTLSGNQAIASGAALADWATTKDKAARSTDTVVR